ncbi:MAG TPA: RICIN domain-containing protein, partial [Sphingobacteriaceae bacterium]
HQDIFYKTSKFTLKTSGKFWMAPGGPTSVPSDTTPWDSHYHACVCTWGKFQDKITGREFFVFNTHFDPGDPDGNPSGAIARLESAKVMLSKAQSIAGGLPSIMIGDFNSNQKVVDGPYSYLQNSALFDEAWEIAGTKAPTCRQTGNWWDPTPTCYDSQIDHIFVSREAQNNWEVLNRTVLWDNYDNVNGIYNDVLPSDHFPVVSEMRLQAPTAPIPNGTYKIIAEHSDKAIVVLGASMSNSAELVQWFYSTTDPKNDEWVFTKIGTTGYYRITNVKSGKDFNVQGNSFVNSAKIIQYDYVQDMQYNDEWSLIDVGNGYYRIVSRSSGLSVNVQGNSTADGANIIQYYYPAGAKNSHFKMVPIP